MSKATVINDTDLYCNKNNYKLHVLVLTFFPENEDMGFEREIKREEKGRGKIQISLLTLRLLVGGGCVAKMLCNGPI